MSLILSASVAAALWANAAINQEIGTSLRTEVDYARYADCLVARALELSTAGETVEATVNAADIGCRSARFELDWAIIQQVQQEIWAQGQAAISREVANRKNQFRQRAAEQATVRLFELRSGLRSNAQNR